MKTYHVSIQCENVEGHKNIEAILKQKLEGTDLKIKEVKEEDPNQYNDVLPSQPQGVEPDTSTAGAGGQVSPDSDKIGPGETEKNY
ncbi:hypothetical protein GJU40_19315 [Bacillus lacus]|uniref:Uncharacterized protein n=1 Tax=Metabacillus lacus TaxID=1983721 RepID=A0A7X2M069_9BACI|nr:hypothetical protein [Metabacillus lacus]MRX74271.1 hypothetical protein [Metabacillus lacus]